MDYFTESLRSDAVNQLKRVQKIHGGILYKHTNNVTRPPVLVCDVVERGLRGLHRGFTVVESYSGVVAIISCYTNGAGIEPRYHNDYSDTNRSFRASRTDITNSSFGENKYTLIPDNSQAINGLQLYRVIYNDGVVGGLVEGKHNLSQAGGCRILSDAIVIGDAMVLDNALVTNGAMLSGKVLVQDNATVSTSSPITGNVTIRDYAFVSCSSTIGTSIATNIIIEHKAGIFDNATIAGTSIVQGITSVYDNALVENALISGEARIWGCSRVIGEHSRKYSSKQPVTVTDYAVISDNALLYGRVTVEGKGYVGGNARVLDMAQVRDNGRVFGNATIEAKGVVQDSGSVFENAHLMYNSRVEGNGSAIGRAVLLQETVICGDNTETGIIPLKAGYLYDGIGEPKTHVEAGATQLTPFPRLSK